MKINTLFITIFISISALSNEVLKDIKFADEKVGGDRVETYRVLDSDTFSSIVEEHTKKSTSTFNENANFIRNLNPQIININKLTVGQLVYLPKVDEKKIARIQENTKKWSVGASYGSSYFNLLQRGVLGNSNIRVNTASSLNLYSQYSNENYKLRIDYESYKLNYKANGSEKSDSLNNFGLSFRYKSFVTNILASEELLFKNNNGTVSHSKVLNKKIGAGFVKDWNLEFKNPTSLEFSSILNYQFAGDSSDKELKLSKSSGYGVSFNTILKRELYKKSLFEIYFVWPTSIGYQENSSTLDWNSTSGISKSRNWEVGTRLGIEARF